MEKTTKKKRAPQPVLVVSQTIAVTLNNGDVMTKEIIEVSSNNKTLSFTTVEHGIKFKTTINQTDVEKWSLNGFNELDSSVNVDANE